MDSIGNLIIPEDQIELVRTAWGTVLAKGEVEAGVVLFKNIFDASPHVAKLFSFVDESHIGDFESLARNEALVKHAVGVVRTVTAVIWMLEEEELVTPVLEDLGARHALYSVEPEHYAIVGSAFLKTMNQTLPPEEFGDDVKEAITALWNQVIALLMQKCDPETIELAKCDLRTPIDADDDDDDDQVDPALLSLWKREL
ncbi:hypothetical protein CTAYLR_007674 [Chrysophaeum taylorii]|uniref:Globin domain-containing protein n=1 Tax=Chrysophaeum taylorii TaxID=2483200 RepID=A0AAD7XI46_9STRA|nr:hypothetical protein CTAYLR_007674 [Chrysophaeum taylorii]